MKNVYILRCRLLLDELEDCCLTYCIYLYSRMCVYFLK